MHARLSGVGHHVLPHLHLQLEDAAQAAVASAQREQQLQGDLEEALARAQDAERQLRTPPLPRVEEEGDAGAAARQSVRAPVCTRMS